MTNEILVLLHRLLFCAKETSGPRWLSNAHLSIIALSESDLEMIKANIMTKILEDYINK